MGTNLRFSHFESDNGTESYSYSAGGSLSYKPTRAVSFGFNASASRTETDRSGGGSVTNDNFLFGASMGYAARNDTNLNASITQSISPSSLGSLTRNTVARIGVNYDINGDSGLSFQLTGSRRDALGGANQAESVQFSANYRRQIARKLDASIGYTLRKPSNASADHRFQFQISRSFDFLP